MRNIQESPRAFCHRYTMRNALGLENLGPYFDNTKLIVAGLIFIPLKYLGFVWIKEDQYLMPYGENNKTAFNWPHWMWAQLSLYFWLEWVALFGPRGQQIN